MGNETPTGPVILEEPGQWISRIGRTEVIQAKDGITGRGLPDSEPVLGARVK